MRCPALEYNSFARRGILRFLAKYLICQVSRELKPACEQHKTDLTKKAPTGFVVLKVIFGELEEYVIVSWGKNPVDEATKYQKTLELIGDEGNKLWLKTQAITKDISNKRAELLPQFSYSLAK